MKGKKKKKKGVHAETPVNIGFISEFLPVCPCGQ